jgi:hypothetical protein
MDVREGFCGAIGGTPRYQSRLWNPAFLREKGLPTPAWLR